MALTEELGITWLCTVVPDKEGVYAEFLPPEVEPAPKRTVHQFLDLARTLGAPVMYPFAALVDAKGDPPLYSPVGTHWNHLGAFVAYRRTCEDLRERGVDVSRGPRGPDPVAGVRPARMEGQGSWRTSTRKGGGACSTTASSTMAG